MANRYLTGKVESFNLKEVIRLPTLVLKGRKKVQRYQHLHQNLNEDESIGVVNTRHILLVSH